MRRGSRLSLSDLTRNTDRLIPTGRYEGIYRAFVKDNKDPQKRGRVKVLVPAIHPEDASKQALPWADVCVHSAGPGRSSIKIPNVEDVVWVMFEQADPMYPVWMGAWWGAPNNSSEMPVKIQSSGNKHYLIMTDEGHFIDLSDDVSEKRITIQTKDGRKIEIDDKNKKIVVSDGETPENSIVLDSQAQQINIEAKGPNFTINIKPGAFGEIKLGNIPIVPCNDFPNCLFTGAVHAIGTLLPGNKITIP